MEVENHLLPTTIPGRGFTQKEAELINYIDERTKQGSYDIVSTQDNLNYDEELHKNLYGRFVHNSTIGEQSILSELFVDESDHSEKAEDTRYEQEFIALVLFDSEVPEEVKGRILPQVYRKRPMKMMNAVRLRNEIKNYIEYKNLLKDKCGMDWHISVPEICLIIGVSVEEWLEYNEPDQIKDARDYFTTLVLAQGTSKLNDYNLKNPAGVLADLKAHAGLKDISHVHVHSGKKRTNVLRKHKAKG